MPAPPPRRRCTSAAPTAQDKGDLRETLRFASLMIGELCTSMLTPKVYFELYMDVFNQLATLEFHFMTLQRGGMAMSELYELVQQAGTVLTRLCVVIAVAAAPASTLTSPTLHPMRPPCSYLMITAGTVYIKSGQASAKAVLSDLIEMVKGVQHPQRGLFLRYYLSQKTKDKLPDVGSPYEGAWRDGRGRRLRLYTAAPPPNRRRGRLCP